MKAIVRFRNQKITKDKSSSRFSHCALKIFAFLSPNLFAAGAFKCCLVILFSTQINFAQPDSLLDAPPPLKILSKAEKSRLDAETDIKRRTTLSIEMMEAKLLKAETLAAEENYPAMFTELGGFHAVVDNTIDFLSEKGNDSNRVLNSFKRVELTLRKHLTRIELIRRELPARYESYVKKLVRYVREARTKAVEPLFDDSVVPENKPI